MNCDICDRELEEVVIETDGPLSGCVGFACPICDVDEFDLDAHTVRCTPEQCDCDL